MNRRKPWVLMTGVLACLSGFDSTAGEPRPFQISRSVTEYCATTPQVMMCQTFEPALAAFLAEKRDAQWAAPVETLIAKSMRVGGKSLFEIRALECRRTRCALEYAVSVDNLDHDVDGNEELERLMEPVAGVVVPELPDGPGKGKIVSVLIWRKR